MEINNKELTYYISTKTKIITLSLSVIFLICGILMLIFKPDAPFYLDPFMESDFPYWGGLLILAFISFIIILSQLGEQRTERYYLTEDGGFDMSTPRSYEKLERPKLIEFFSRNGINNFYYDGQGKVYIENGKGKEIEAPLSELKIKYWMRKNEATGDFYIHKMRVTDSQGNKLSFTTNDSLMPSEFDDIHMILSNAAEVEESKLSKADKWAYKLKGVVEDFDFKNISDSVAEIIVSHGVPAASNSIINFVKMRLYRQTEKKTGFRKFWGSLKKFFNNFLLVLIGLYLLMIIIVNVANLPVIFGGHDTKEYDYNETENYYDNADDAVDAADEIQSLDITLSGKVTGRNVEMNLTFFSQLITNEEGMEYNVAGYLTQPYEAPLIGMLTDNSLNLDEYSDNVEYAYITEQFMGDIEEIDGQFVYKGFIWIDGDKYPFTLKSNKMETNVNPDREAQKESIEMSFSQEESDGTTILNITVFNEPKRDKSGNLYNVEGSGYYSGEAGRQGFDLIGTLNDGELKLKEILYGAEDYEIFLIGRVSQKGNNWYYEGTKYINGKDVIQFKFKGIE